MQENAKNYARKRKTMQRKENVKKKTTVRHINVVSLSTRF